MCLLAMLFAIGSAQAAVVFEEDFSGGIPSDWTTVDNNGDGYTWEAVNSSYDGCAFEPPVAVCDSDANAVAYDDELWTPSLDLSECSGIVLKVTHTFNDLGGVDDAYIDISTDGGSTWTNIQHWDGVDHLCAMDEEFDISAIADGQSDVIIRFHYVTGGTWQWWWAIDKVWLEGVCPGVFVTPGTSVEQGDPGATVTHTFTIENYSGSSGTAAITCENSEWDVSCPSEVGPIADGETATFDVEVTIPECFMKYSDSVDVHVELNGYGADATAITQIGWTQHAALPAPGRFDHGLAYWESAKGGFLYAVGGSEDGSSPLYDLDIFDIDSGSWSSGAAATKDLTIVAARAVNGKVIIPGGVSYSSGTGDDYTTLIYDIEDESWSTGADVPSGQPTATYALCTDGQYLYRAGGTVAANWGVPYNSFLRYDPDADSWETLANMPTARWWSACGYIDGKVYVVGGMDAAGDGLSSVDVYDVESDTWEAKAVAPCPVTVWGAAYGVVNGKLYIAGGIQNGIASSSCYYYDPAADEWNECPDMPNVIFRMAGVGAGDTFYVAGGMNPVWFVHDYVYSLPGLCLPAPVVSSIDPSEGTNDGVVSVTITGDNFVPDNTTAKLSGPAKADIVADNLTVVDSQTITCDFDLTGAEPGMYDVVVTTPYGEGMLEDGFEVTEPAADDDTADDDTGGEEEEDEDEEGCGCAF